MKQNNNSILNYLGIKDDDMVVGFNDDNLKILVNQIQNTSQLISLIQEEMEFAVDDTTTYRTDRIVSKTSHLLDKYAEALATASLPYTQAYYSRGLNAQSKENDENEKRTYTGLERENSEFVRQHRHSIVKLKEHIRALQFRITDNKLAKAQFDLDKALSQYLTTPIADFSPKFEENLTNKHLKVTEGEQIAFDI